MVDDLFADDGEDEDMVDGAVFKQYMDVNYQVYQDVVQEVSEPDCSESDRSGISGRKLKKAKRYESLNALERVQSDLVAGQRGISQDGVKSNKGGDLRTVSIED